MDKNTFMMAIFIALGFVGWPIVGGYSRASGAWIATLVMAGTMPVVISLSAKQLSISLPSLKGVCVLLVAAVINGVAVHLYSAKIADDNIPRASFVVTVAILMTIIAPLLNWGLNGGAPTFRQITGFLIAAVAIYLIGK